MSDYIILFFIFGFFFGIIVLIILGVGYLLVNTIKTKKNHNTAIVSIDKVERISSDFMEDANGIFKVNNQPITDDEIPTVIEMSYERSIRNDHHYCNRFEDILPPNRGNNKLNDAEIAFMKEFYNQLLSNKIKPYIYTGRMGSGTLDVQYKGNSVGRVNLIGEKCWIQYRVGKYGNIKDLYGSLDDIMPYIHKWIRYIINYL